MDILPKFKMHFYRKKEEDSLLSITALVLKREEDDLLYI